MKNVRRIGVRLHQCFCSAIILIIPIICPAQSQMTLADELQKTLEAQGWQAYQVDDGSLIYRQPAASPITELPKQAATAPGTQPMAGQVPSDTTHDLPGLRYWRVVKSKDGSMLFYPLPATDAAGQPAVSHTTGKCCAGDPQLIDRISLPVDKWDEAKELAQNWIDSSGLHGVQVGRIRKVLRVYLVSLVRESPPHALQHQLAIRASDGCVLVVD